MAVPLPAPTLPAVPPPPPPPAAPVPAAPASAMSVAVTPSDPLPDQATPYLPVPPTVRDDTAGAPMPPGGAVLPPYEPVVAVPPETTGAGPVNAATPPVPFVPNQYVAPEPPPADLPAPAVPPVPEGSFGAFPTGEFPTGDARIVGGAPDLAGAATPESERSVDSSDADDQGNDDIEVTLISTARRPVARFRLIGEGLPPMELDGGTYIAGRKPSQAGRPNARPLQIRDQTRTLSKTHAILEFTEVGLVITDLGSTNGSRIVGADASTILEFTPGEPALVPDGNRFQLGDLTFSWEVI